MFLILRRGPFSVCKHHLDGLLKHKLLGPAPKELDSVGLGWTLRVAILLRFLMLLIVEVLIMATNSSALLLFELSWSSTSLSPPYSVT